MSHRLREKEIEKYLFEDIPSDNESICSYEDHEEEAENQPNPMVLGDLIGVQIADDAIYDSDDDLPLSSRFQRNPDSTESNNVSSNMPVMVAPKWKKNYRMDMPGEFSERVSLSDQIFTLLNLESRIYLSQQKSSMFLLL